VAAGTSGAAARSVSGDAEGGGRGGIFPLDLFYRALLGFRLDSG
jgi:hypothetical protein